MTHSIQKLTLPEDSTNYFVVEVRADEDVLVYRAIGTTENQSGEYSKLRSYISAWPSDYSYKNPWGCSDSLSLREFPNSQVSGEWDLLGKRMALPGDPSPYYVLDIDLSADEISFRVRGGVPLFGKYSDLKKYIRNWDSE